MVIFALVTLISNMLFHLFMVNTTFVHLGPLIQEITSLKEFSFHTSFPSTFMIWSPAFNHAFCDGEPDISKKP